MKEVIFIDINGQEIEALVAGCEEGIGITIVKKEDKKAYLLCSIGKFSPLWKSTWTEEEEEEASNHFKYLSEKIEDGIINAKDFIKKFNIPPSFRIPTANNCSFAQ